MKNFIAVALLSLLPFSAFAVESEGSIELKNGALYRGEKLTDEDFSISGVLRLTDFLIDGLYVSLSSDALDTHDTDSIVGKGNEYTVYRFGDTLRNRVAVGFVGSVWDLGFDVSASRVFNPVLQIDDYYEVSAEVQTGLRLANHIDFYGHVSHAMSDVDLWYAGVGVVAQDVFVSGLHGRLGVNFYHYDRELTLNDWTRNNVEASLTYRIFDTVDGFVLYSGGHRGSRGQELDNEVLFGIRVNF